MSYIEENSVGGYECDPTSPKGPSSMGMDNGSEEGLELTNNVVQGLRVAKVFRENTDSINSIDFSSNGDFMVSAADDDQIIVYDCGAGSIKKSIKSKKYGVSFIRFAHSTNTVIHGSTKIDDTIRYLSLYDNKYLRYFQGHTARVTSLSMSPTDDRFISTSLDKTLRLWDLRSHICQGLMYLPGKPVAAFDPEGLIFAAGVHNDSIKLYDLRSFDKGPFMTIRLPYDDDNEWECLKFSPDGKNIMLTICGSPVIRILDSFQGTPLHTLIGHRITHKNLSIEATYTPDSKYIFSGSEDGKVLVWNAETGHQFCILNGEHPRCVQCVRFNPKYMMMASACTDMSFWLPNTFV